MTTWWRKGLFMPKYVTEGHFDKTFGIFKSDFDRTIAALRQDFNDRFDGLDNKFVTKDEFNTRMDEMMVILKRIDQERIFTIEWIRRIETDVTRLKQQPKQA